jgi:hypothetical protein
MSEWWLVYLAIGAPAAGRHGDLRRGRAAFW